MTWQQGVDLIDRLAWPLIVAALVLILGPAIRQFLREAKSVSFSGAGFEASANRDDVAAAAALGAAVQHKTNGAETAKELPDIAPLIEKTSSPRSRRKLQQSKVLWVDNWPKNNLYERRALEALGIQIDLANDSQDALRKLSSKEYDLVVSCMTPSKDEAWPSDKGLAKGSSEQAGYELLTKVRHGGNSVPFIIFAGPKVPQKLLKNKRGAQVSNNDPHQLFKLAVGQLLR